MIKYVAELDDNSVVVRAIVCDSVEWATENLGGVWIASDEKVGMGFTYDEAREAFIPPKPFESWVLNEETYTWEAPVPMPEDGDYYWNESTVSWEPVSEA